MNTLTAQNVARLSDYRKQLTDRQEAILEIVTSYASRPASEIPTAMVAIAVRADGTIRFDAIQVEPEHVLPILAAMREASNELELYLHRSIAL